MTPAEPTRRRLCAAPRMMADLASLAAALGAASGTAPAWLRMWRQPRRGDAIARRPCFLICGVSKCENPPILVPFVAWEALQPSADTTQSVRQHTLSYKNKPAL